MSNQVKVKFWGTRGIVSAPNSNMKKYGGNTTCIQIVTDDDIILIDAGFGISNFGEVLFNKNKKTVHILFTHMHWDHVQGMTFFHPIYFKNSIIKLHSPYKAEHLSDSLNEIFDPRFSPFESINSMPAQVEFNQLTPGFQIAGFDIDFHPVNHGCTTDAAFPAYAYRFTHQKTGQVISIVNDHDASSSVENERIVRFAEHSDILIHDAQYTHEEHAQHRNWGHSSMRAAIGNAIKMNAANCLLTHHAPHRTDDDLDKCYERLKKEFPNTKFEFAKENQLYAVSRPQKNNKAG